jgi:hypothetical protein
MVGTAHLWHLLSFAYHQARANGRPADALFRQQQTLLRTLPTPSSVMADALKLWWAWRKKTDRPFLRSIVLIIMALLFTVATVAASIFSSLVVSGGTIDVLVDSPLCGRVNSNPLVGRAYALDNDQLAPGYALNCYKNGSLPSSCDVFMQPNIPLAVRDAPCPFKNATFCATKEAVNVDSGLLDVGATFGLNVAAKDRVQYRKSTTCTVLPMEGFWGVYNAKDYPSLKYLQTFPNEQLGIVSYGTTFEEAEWATYTVSLTLSNITARPAVSQ